MQFVKKMVYLGYSSMTFARDNSVMHTVSFFDAEDQNTVSVNVMDSRTAVSSVLPSLSFGAPCQTTFSVRTTTDKQSGKSYCKLGLVEVVPVPVK